ncbi:sorting nexin-25, partial [Phenoliferia sp. Uapishka_3]
MSSRLSYQSLGACICVAVLAARFPRSITTFIIFTPIFLIITALGWIALDLYASWWVERLLLKRLDDAQLRDDLAGVARARSHGSGRVGGGQQREGKSRGRRRIPQFTFTSPAAWDMTQTRASWAANNSSHRPPFPGATPLLSASIDSLFDLIMRDFVLKWFEAISDSPAFPNAVEKTIRETLAAVVSRVDELDWSDAIVGKILPLVTTHVDTFRTAEQALRGQDLRTQLTESDELDLFLASRYASDTTHGKLHPAVDVASPNSRPAEEAWLSNLFGRILPLIMPEREVESLAVKIMAREIVACAVILPIIELLSDPDFWNRMIDDKAGAAIRDQQMVDQFREALDKQETAISATSLAASSSVRRTRRTEEISVRTNPKQFETFVRGIGQCNSLLDARRLRSDVASQIRKTRNAVEGKSKNDYADGHKVSDMLEYIERLYTARRKADKRIEQLGGMEASSRYSLAGDTPTPHPRRVSLRDILLQPTSLSYFMEFQDRRRRSLRVQFWLLVEGLKAPLEDVDSDSDDEKFLPPPSAAATETAREDMNLIWDTYFSTNALKSNQKYIRIVRDFVRVAGAGVIGTKDIRKVRQAVIAAQRDVFTEMEEEDFIEFEKSDLFFKALADIPESSQDDPITFYPAALSPTAAPARQRASSHPNQPAAPNSPPSSYQLPGSISPRTANFPLPYAHPAITLQRTETAPPKVTLEAVFHPRPVVRRSASEEHERAPSRTGSLGSLDGTFGAGSGGVGGKRRSTPLSDSLDFLMSSPGGEEDEGFRSPLFVDEEGSEIEAPLRDGTRLSEDDFVQVQTIEAIQEALSSILATDANRASSHQQPEATSRHFTPTTMKPALRGRTSSPKSGRGPSSRIPSTTSVKSTSEEPRSGRGVFGDDEEDLDCAAMDDEEPEEDFDPTSIRLAAPGDLQLPGEIARLGTTLEKLANQEAVVGALIRKAELTGNASELKILVKSRESLRRETRALSFQKGQYELQSESNKLVSGRTIVTISGTTVGQAEGQSFQLYLVEVHQLALDGTFASGWIVTRRYSEFAVLHTNLKEKYVAARPLDFPSKRLVTPYSEGFIEQRKLGLQNYLQVSDCHIYREETFKTDTVPFQALIRIPVICQSIELRSFLSQQNISLPKLDAEAGKRNASFFPGQGLVRSFYRTVTSGIDEMLTAGPASMMDTVIQRLSQQAAELSGIGGSGVQDEDLVGQLLSGQAGANLPGGLRAGEEGLTYFTAPICELFVTLFELKEKNNWLRRQAILIILQQILGGTIERKFRDAVKMLIGPEQLANYISTLTNGLWPGGQLKPKEPPRTPLQRATTKASANRKLSALMPDIAANLIGRTNAKHGARRLFAVLQNRRLNRHLIYSVIDEFVQILFPELEADPVVPGLPTASSRPLFP